MAIRAEPSVGSQPKRKTLRKIAIGLAVLIAGIVVLYKASYPTYTHRYRLTIAIEVDGQVHTGSSVIEVIARSQPRIFNAFAVHVHGQAAVVDLGSHGAVVAALHPGTVQNGSVAADSLALTAYGIDDYGEIGKQRGKRALVPKNMPLLIWFSDVTDKTTARVITASSIPGRLKEASVEITRDRVAIDIDKKLPWYKGLAESQKHGLGSYPNVFQLVYNMLIGND